MNPLDPTEKGVAGIGKRRAATTPATHDATACDSPPVQPLPERLLNKRELANYLGVCTRTVERLVKAGLPALIVARRRKFDRVEVMAWLRKKEKRRG